MPRSPLSLSSRLIDARGIGPVRSAELAAVGLETVGDLLRVLPHRFEDRREVSIVAAVEEGGSYTLRGRLAGVSRVRLRRRGLSLVRGGLVDDSGRLAVLWFNRPYLAQQIDAEAEYLLHGRVRRGKSGLELLNPSVEKVPDESGGRLAARILPVYPSLGTLGPARVGNLVRKVLEQTDLEPGPADELPADLMDRHDLPPFAEALAALHRPSEEADVEALNERTSAAHARLAYQELLELQLEVAFVRRRVAGRRKPYRCRLGATIKARVESIPPFALTAAQRRCFGEIAADMGSDEPMMRLLQGDVGCGKTIVAAMVLALAAENGLQGALMAPTELLAEQHHAGLSELLGERYRVELVTGSVTGAAVRRALASGEIQIAVGTHALIQDRVAFHRLGLAVVDEQHRFGVAQRRRLEEKGERPDLLVMTATPIPRSLALTVYGDLESSVIDEMPPGRRPVETRVEEARKRRRVLEWVAGRLSRGDQAYVVCPLIEASESVDASSIESLAPEVEGLLDGHAEWAVLHGSTPADEREEIVRRFAAGAIRLLLATTIVEVGVDVPGATVMVIDSAERFGLAQLHQLRGRVGRGGEKSYCVALHGRLSEEGSRRLEVFAGTTDGFAIAEADLEIRGPGDFLGNRQSGAPFLRVASLIADREWLEKARADAAELAGRADSTRHPLVAAARERAADLERRLAGA